MIKSLAMLLLSVGLFVGAAAPVLAQEDSPVPFSVSIGGQAVAAKAGASFGTVEKPVDANAALEVGSKADPVIINIVASAADGTPKEGAPTLILLIQGGGGKTTLDKTMDGSKLTSGTYLMNVVADGKTARVVFSVK